VRRPDLLLVAAECFGFLPGFLSGCKVIEIGALSLLIGVAGVGKGRIESV
jgi:hypothetical protein